MFQVVYVPHNFESSYNYLFECYLFTAEMEVMFTRLIINEFGINSTLVFLLKGDISLSMLGINTNYNIVLIIHDFIKTSNRFIF